MNLAFWNQLYFVLLMKSHLESYPCPLIINSFWNVGFLLGITIIAINMIVKELFFVCQKLPMDSISKLHPKIVPTKKENRNSRFIFWPPFYPFIISKDLYGNILILYLYLLQTHFGFSSFSHPDNALEACGLLTPLHIVPEWYFLCHGF